MMFKILNYKDNDVVRLSLPLIIGELNSSGDRQITVKTESYDRKPVKWPVLGGKFKVLVQLSVGENSITFSYKNITFRLRLFYKPLDQQKFVRLVYIKCKDDNGNFQAPDDENNSVYSACKRITLAVKMLQTFTSDKMREHSLDRKTFCLEEINDNVTCHVFNSSLSVTEAHKLNQEQLWSHFATELMNSNLRSGNDCKFLAFLSCTYYCNTSNKLPMTHSEIVSMTRGHAAIGGGGLALIGTASLHTWAEDLQQIPWRFGDNRKINRVNFMDDSCNRGYYWANYSTGLGATLHELGHTFDLGHTVRGIMARGFDDIYKHFIVDMFYCDHLFQKENNPFYQGSSLNFVVPLSPVSPVSLKPSLEESIQNLKVFSEVKNSQENTLLSGEKPLGIPIPTSSYHSEHNAVHIGGAYWTRSCALLLYYHKWFNDEKSEKADKITLNGGTLSSSHGVRVVEFRNDENLVFHHLEYLEEDGKEIVDLSSCNILSNIPEDASQVNLVAEDSVGNILKSQLDIEIFRQ